MKYSDDWSYVAFVVDRVFMILFTLINIVGTILIVKNAPLLKDFRQPMRIPAQPTKPLGGDILSKFYMSNQTL